MFLVTVICLVASTFALPSLELPAPSESLTLPVLEVDFLDTIIPNDEQTEQTTETTVNQVTNNSPDKREEEEKRFNEELKKRIIFLSAVPSPPELPPLDESILASLLKPEKSEDSENGSENVKPFILKWRLPKIRFPGRFIIDDIFGPHLTYKN